MKLPNFTQVDSFDWDLGNFEKNWIKHKVTQGEVEEIFFNEPLLITKDKAHSENESRYGALGITNTSRRLFAVFTIRNRKIRIISVRDVSRKERKVYENHKKENS